MRRSASVATMPGGAAPPGAAAPKPPSPKGGMRRAVSFGSLEQVLVPSARDMSTEQITERWYEHGDYKRFARAELSRRKSAGTSG